MPNVAYFEVERECNSHAVGGIANLELRMDLRAGRAVCPVRRERVVVETSRPLNGSHAESIAADQVRGWCDDPCSLCKARASDPGGLSSIEVDGYPVRIARLNGQLITE